MDPIYLFGGLLSALVKGYPETRVIRFVLNKIGLTNLQNVIITFVISFLINATFVLAVGTIDFASFIIYETVGLGILSLIDYQRGNDESLIMKIIHNTFVRILLIIFRFISVYIISLGVLQARGLDPYYLLTPVIAIIYTYIAYRRKRRKITPTASGDGQQTTPSI